MLNYFMTLSVHDIGAADDFRVGRPTRVEVDGRGVVVVNTGLSFYAVRDVCPHQGARLSKGRCKGRVTANTVGAQPEIRVDDLVLQCAWHGWSFDLVTGPALTDPDRARVRTYQVHLDAGRVLLDLG